MTVLSPFVYWAQSEKDISLKIDLKDVKNPQINLNENRNLQFQTKGTGAQGINNYGFSLDFYAEVQQCDDSIKRTDNSIYLSFPKIEKAWWPRLISQLQKPAWLKVDFDRWQSEDDLIDEEYVRDIREDYPELFNQLQKEEVGYRKEDFKKVYLTFYNFFMFTGFLYVVSILAVKYVKDGPKCFPEIYSSVGPAMRFLQLIQFLEVMHPLFGYVRGGLVMPLMQVFGRFFILFPMLEFEPRIQAMPVVFYLFLSWTVIEIIRYPYYISQLYKKEIFPLTWLRYSAWMILYPTGFLCEAVIVFRNMIFVHKSHKWSIGLPNSFNFTFDFLTFLRIYLLFIMFPAIYTLMKHMYNTRLQKLGGKEPFVKSLLKNKVH